MGPVEGWHSAATKLEALCVPEPAASVSLQEVPGRINARDRDRQAQPGLHVRGACHGRGLFGP